MRKPSIVIALLAFTATAQARVVEPECPASNGEERLRMVEAAPSCTRANAVNDRCSEATGADTIPSQAVIDKCEKDFIGKASRARLAAYAREKARCQRKYAHQSGTMYVSFTMYCLAHAAAKFSGK